MKVHSPAARRFNRSAFLHLLNFFPNPAFLNVGRFRACRSNQAANFNKSTMMHSQNVNGFNRFLFLHRLRLLANRVFAAVATFCA
jgi:hypothetical protein